MPILNRQRAESSFASSSQHATVAIIGAGAAGLVTAKTFLKAGLAVTVYEAGSHLSGLSVYENDNGSAIAYKNLYILTPKRYTQWRDFPMHSETPEYARHSDMARYFEQYTDHFHLRDHIRFNDRVTSVDRHESRWRVTSSQGIDLYDAVVVATGHFHTPRWPQPLDGFSGEIMHSSKYRDASQILNKRVLVIGLGNSACDIAADVSWAAEKAVISARTPIFSGPRWFFGHAVLDVMHHFQGPRVPRRWKGRVVSFLVKVYWGDMARWGIRKPAKAAHGVFHEFILPILRYGRLTIRPDIASVAGRTITFVDGQSDEFDVVIAATGYQLAFPFLNGLVKLNEQRSEVDDLYLRVFSIDQPSLYFVGLTNNNGLANTPTFERQAELIADVVLGRVSLPGPDEMRRAVQARRARGRALFLESARHALEEPHPDYLIDLIDERRRGRPDKQPVQIADDASTRCWLCGCEDERRPAEVWHATDWGLLRKRPSAYTKPVRLCMTCVEQVQRSRRAVAEGFAAVTAVGALAATGAAALIVTLIKRLR